MFLTKKDQKKIANFVRSCTNCSHSEANRAADTISRDRRSLALLAKACGISAAVTGASIGFAAEFPPALLITAKSLPAAKRFCTKLINTGCQRITDESVRELANAIGVCKY